MRLPRPLADPVVLVLAGLAVLMAATGAAAVLTSSPRETATLAAVRVDAPAAVVDAPDEGADRQGAPTTTRASPDWVAGVSTATGIGPVAVRAYADATLTLAAEQPGCHLGWTTLAGIGAIESGHGTHGGAVLQEDGRPSIPVVGPALDGRPGFAAIRSTPTSAAWHGDPTWDHAVGPLQFLPSTWARWGADGDGDGVADPQDLDDAALAAGRYLCAAGDLATAAGWQAAVRSYNHDDVYVARVRSAADAAATASRTVAG